MFREYIEIDKINKHSISLIIDATGGRFDYKSKKKPKYKIILFLSLIFLPYQGERLV